MNSDYLTDEEYQTYWVRLGGLREIIGEDLGPTSRMEILDVGIGYGYFAIEMAKQLEKGEVVGIDISSTDATRANKIGKVPEALGIVSVLKMDATELAFADNCFDLAASFLGMRDIHMTGGREGVEEAVREMIRVVRPSGKIALCITPPEDMETEDQRIAVKVEGEVFGAVSLSKEFYIKILKENNVILNQIRTYYTNKKLTAKQTKIELKDGIGIAKKIYGKEVPEFEDVWDKYGKEIEAFGYGMYSKIVMLLAEKPNGEAKS